MHKPNMLYSFYLLLGTFKITDMNDKDNSTDKWECPFCKHEGAVIIEEAVLKNDWKEILCGCMECDEMYIRKYKFAETIRLVRSK